MNKAESLELLKSIINSNNEFRPTPTDKRWKQVINEEYHVMKSSINYEVPKKLVKLMKKYSKIYNSLKTEEKDDIIDKYDDNIAIIYLLENDKTMERYVGYTTNPLFTFIKLNMHKDNIGEENVFDNFGNNEYNNFTFEIVEYVKYNTRKDIFQRKRVALAKYINKTIEKAIDESKKPNVDYLDKIYDKRMDIFYEVLGGQVSQFKSFFGYIYKIRNLKNNKVFIGGYHRLLSKKTLLDMLTKSDDLLELIHDIKKYGRRNISMNIIEKYDAKTMFDFLLRIDYHKIKQDSIENGYNKGFSIDESELLFDQRLLTSKRNILKKRLFLKIQKHLFEKNFKDDNIYDNVYGYVYQIQNKKSKKRYIATVYNKKLKNIVIKMYNSALKGNVKHSKILKALEEETYNSFTFKILKVKKMDDQRIDLEDETANYIAKYDTINNGYNIDKKKLRRNIAISRRSKR